MAYDTEDILVINASTWLDYWTDDIVVGVDNTVCLTNGTVSEDCDETKSGEEGQRIVIAIPPATVTAIKIRVYLNSIMSTGNNSILAYTDANSVTLTGENEQDYSSAGQWVEHILSSTLIAQLGDLGDSFALRFGTNSGAKSKIGEIEVDVTWDQPQLSGITKDKDGSVLVSCEVALFKVIDEGPPETYEYKESQISDPSTGAYSFGVYEGSNYMVYAVKDNSPHVFDATDNVLEADP